MHQSPSSPMLSGHHNGLWSIWLLMVKLTLCDLLVIPPVILTVNGCDKLFYVVICSL